MHKAAIEELTHGGEFGNIPWLHDHLVDQDLLDSGAYSADFHSKYLKDSVSQTSLWIYLLITERFVAHRVEAPIISRLYQELSHGMLGFHNAVKIKTTPFPFPFAQIISISMFVLTVTLPIVISQFVDDLIWCIVFTLLTCFGYFMLSEVACELEQPFGDDENDLPLVGYQVEFDKELLCLCEIMSYECPEVNRSLIRTELPSYESHVSSPALENHMTNESSKDEMNGLPPPPRARRPDRKSRDISSNEHKQGSVAYSQNSQSSSSRQQKQARDGFAGLEQFDPFSRPIAPEQILSDDLVE